MLAKVNYDIDVGEKKAPERQNNVFKNKKKSHVYCFLLVEVDGRGKERENDYEYVKCNDYLLSSARLDSLSLWPPF